jgi:general secretion pathway protein D
MAQISIVCCCASILLSCVGSPNVSLVEKKSISEASNVLPEKVSKSVDSVKTSDKLLPKTDASVQKGVGKNKSNTQSSTARPTTYVGTGSFINRKVALQRPGRPVAVEGKVALEFSDTNISEVVRTILGELLEETYIISPEVQGVVTFSTAKPIPETQLRYVLETLLSWNSASLVLREGIYHIVPTEKAIAGQLSPSIGPLPNEPGYDVQIVPLKYIAASEMLVLLKPFLTEKAVLHADNERSFLMLAGTVDQLRNYMRTIEIFDVDWFEGMSVGIFRLEVAEPSQVIQELGTLLGENSGIKKQVRFMPMNRLNSVVAITQKPDLLKKIKKWTERLDQQLDLAGNSAEQRLYVYHVKNVDAKKLSETLKGIFSSSEMNARETKRTSSSALSPGLVPVEIDRNGSVEGVNSLSPDSENNQGLSVQSFSDSDVSISFVEQNNALLIKSSPIEYRSILNAIKQLDVTPLQVLIETVILEVTLTDGLSYGVEWYLKNAASEFLTTNSSSGGDGFLRLGSEGVNYLLGKDNIGVAISALKSGGKTKILSSPSLWALNNQRASINVGTQIPIVSTSIDTSGNGEEISQVQYLDTGVILTVTPRIHPGGLVFLDVSQNISNPTGSADSRGNVSIAQRELKTKVAVNSGETVLLGGLISDVGIDGQSGVPLLSKIPVLGNIFGRTSKDLTRTEIVAFITPTVIYNEEKTNQIMEEYQQRFQYIDTFDFVNKKPKKSQKKLSDETPKEDI